MSDEGNENMLEMRTHMAGREDSWEADMTGSIGAIALEPSLRTWGPSNISRTTDVEVAGRTGSSEWLFTQSNEHVATHLLGSAITSLTLHCNKAICKYSR